MTYRASIGILLTGVVFAVILIFFKNELFYAYWDARYGGNLTWNEYRIELGRGRFIWNVSPNRLLIENRDPQRSWLVIERRDANPELARRVIRDICRTTQCRDTYEEVRLIGQTNVLVFGTSHKLSDDERMKTLLVPEGQKLFIEFDGGKKTFPSFEKIAISIIVQKNKGSSRESVGEFEE